MCSSRRCTYAINGVLSIGSSNWAQCGQAVPANHQRLGEVAYLETLFYRLSKQALEDLNEETERFS